LSQQAYAHVARIIIGHGDALRDDDDACSSHAAPACHPCPPRRRLHNCTAALQPLRLATIRRSICSSHVGCSHAAEPAHCCPLARVPITRRRCRATVAGGSQPPLQY
jgi:hypothetical protein